MRIEASLRLDNPKFPKDYRNYFISFVKTVFTKSNSFDNLYKEKKTKPFVFSLWLGENFEIEEDEILFGDRISLLFSTGDPIIFAYFYNGLISIKEKNEKIPLGKANLEVEKISLQPLKKIKDKKILCKTIGISILTNPEEPAKDFRKWYIIPTDDLDLFNDVLRKRTNERYEQIKGIKGNFGIWLKTLSNDEFFVYKSLCKKSGLTNSINETIVKHYGAWLRGFRGIFFLEGDEEILQFVYDYGIGVRTGQGFGMIEILG